MAEVPVETPSATQKRPLEEPSSPSGPTDQPEAKRPALDKIIKDEDTSAAEADDKAAAKQPAASGDAESSQAGVNTAETATGAEPVTTDKQGDTVVPDVPTNGDTAEVANTALPNSVTGSIVITAAEIGADAQAAANQAQDETSWLHIRSIITTTEAATIIGKNGENVTQIRKLAGSKCTVSEYVRGAVERILTVSGPVDAVAKAFGLIIRTLNQEPLDQPSTPQSKTYPLRLLIPHILIGSIIGKGGANIREVQEASGARLNVSEMCLAPSTERSLVILGVADAVHIATYYVGRTLVQQLKERFGGPAASNYAGRHGGPQGVVPGGMQVVPYNPQHVGGQMGHPDSYRKNAVPPQRAPANVHSYGAPYMHPQAPQPQTHAPMHYGGAAAPRAPYVGAGPQQAQPYGHAGQAVGHAGPPQQPAMGAMGPGQPITQQIFIPNDMVGAIIGKGGQKINEIRQLSGSIIKINEPQDNNNERLVTVTGTAECNQMALYMLYSRLGESSKNSNAIMPR